MSRTKFTSYRVKVEKATAEGIARALEICGGTAEAYAVKECPIRTGRLSNSITHAQQNDTTEVVGTNVEYAPYVELGTRYQSPHPYLAPAVEQHREEYENIIKGELSKG